MDDVDHPGAMLPSINRESGHEATDRAFGLPGGSHRRVDGAG